MSNKEKSKATNKETVRGEDRTKRVGLGTMKRSMAIPKGLIKEGYVPRIVNDNPRGRIQAAIDGGYEFVLSRDGQRVHLGENAQDGNTDIGSKISMIVDKSPRVTGEVRGYLMQIKREWYEADQKLKLRKTEERDRVIRDGKSGDAKGNNFYAEVNYET